MNKFYLNISTSKAHLFTCRLLMSLLPLHPVWLHQTRIGLSLYDVAGQGYLRESVCSSSVHKRVLN